MNELPVKRTPPRHFLPLREDEVFALTEKLMTQQKRYLDPGLTMESLAAEMNVRRNILSRAVNMYAGESFTQWLNRYRVAEVERLVACEKESLEKLALRSGFSSRTTFYRVFGKLRGAAPGSLLRKQMKESQPDKIINEFI